MTSQRMRIRSASAGYSLSEMLVVITIIGVLSMVSIPQFVSYQRANQLKSSMQMVMNDLRLARQQAISLRTQTRMRFATNASSYVVERRSGANWVPLGRTSAGTGTRTLEPNCSLATPSGLGTVTIDSVDYNTVVFLLDGTAQVTGADSKGTFLVRTTASLPTTQYTVEVRTPGFVKAIAP